MVVPVILCGGSGTRLWPQSRKAYPKQFHALHHPDYSLLQETIVRAKQISDERPILVTNEHHRFIVAEQCMHMDVHARILLEPEARNTAPAIGLAAMAAMEADDDAVIFVMPSDHVITGADNFAKAVNEAAMAAQEGLICTFGIKPTRPETGYGYIKAGPDTGHGQVRHVAAFTEKPDLATATEFFADGNYSWNGGMFCLKASIFLEEWSKFDAEAMTHLKTSFDKREVDHDFTRFDAASFAQVTEDSIDYAIMEKTERASVIELDAGWSDVGAWDAVWALEKRDQDGNALRGETITIDATNNLIHADKLTIAAVGVDNLVIIESDDAILVAKRDEAQKVKRVVQQLDATGSTKHQLHRKVFRPWGAYDSVDQGERFQVKRITVKPGAKLSLQMHHHRAEHWIVVTGTAKVTCGDKTFLLSENQSTYIPLGQVHRLENPGTVPLELIEVQSGSYLGEDDIVRFEDTYGRS